MFCSAGPGRGLVAKAPRLGRGDRWFESSRPDPAEGGGPTLAVGQIAGSPACPFRNPEDVGGSPRPE